MNHFEVEVKSLLGDADRARSLREKLKSIDPAVSLLSSNTQLNHYFEGGSLEALSSGIKAHLAPEVWKKFHDLAQKAKDFSLRSREKNGDAFLVLKASLDAGTSANGISRVEFEEPVDMTLEALDRIILDSGFQYQAKWSREREEYVCRGTTVCLDKNAGYGYLAEFERVVPEEALISEAQREIKTLMDACGVAELPQDRLERMFAFYNAHWPEYYGTDRVFTLQ